MSSRDDKDLESRRAIEEKINRAMDKIITDVFPDNAREDETEMKTGGPEPGEDARDSDWDETEEDVWEESDEDAEEEVWDEETGEDVWEGSDEDAGEEDWDEESEEDTWDDSDEDDGENSWDGESGEDAWDEESEDEDGDPEEEIPVSRQKRGSRSRTSAGVQPMGNKNGSRSARPKKITYVPITEEDLNSDMIHPKRKKKHKGLKVTGLVAAIMLVAAGSAYAAVSYYYSDRFFNGTTINGIDCSGKTAYEVEQELTEKVENYSIQVLSRNLEPQTISGSQINYSYVSDGTVLELLKAQKPYQWILGYMEDRSYTIEENAAYDKTLLQAEVKALECAQEENQVEPEDAYVALNGNVFEIMPETEGSQLQVKEAYKALDEAISGSQSSVDFNSSPDVYVQAAVTSDSAELQATRDAYNNYTKASITYTFGVDTVTLDVNTLKDWMEINEKGQLVQDDASFQQHIQDYVAQLASQYDTVGTQREFHTTSGRTVYVYGSAYGWQIDQEAEVEQLTQEIRSGAQTTREPIYEKTANARGYNDLGGTYIEVDLSTQHMYYYQNGSIIFDSAIVSGDMRYEDRKTPEGIYTLYFKKSPEILKGKLLPDGTYEYETEVTFWMPFNGGVGFHDATWQPYFGGDRYLVGGSHGCINMPYDSAATLYQIIDYNVPIICFY